MPWLANLIDVPTILAAAHRAKQAGADIVVLSLHWGTEYHTPRDADQQRDQARQLLGLAGHRPDPRRPRARGAADAADRHGKWVIYCMGNQISRHDPTRSPTAAKA